jgi:hypothetical protein
MKMMCGDLASTPSATTQPRKQFIGISMMCFLQHDDIISQHAIGAQEGIK